MSAKDFIAQQRDGMKAMATGGVIGLHMVSGPLVGAAIGFALNYWLNLGNWFIILFLFIGIGAGFLNVWRDTQVLLHKMEKEKTKKNAANAPGQTGAPTPERE